MFILAKSVQKEEKNTNHNMGKLVERREKQPPQCNVKLLDFYYYGF